MTFECKFLEYLAANGKKLAATYEDGNKCRRIGNAVLVIHISIMTLVLRHKESSDRVCTFEGIRKMVIYMESSQKFPNTQMRKFIITSHIITANPWIQRQTKYAAQCTSLS